MNKKYKFILELLFERGILFLQFGNLYVGHTQEFRRGLQYHFALSMASEIKEI